MRALLDINVLIALMDAAHAFHARAHEWWAENAGFGWGSCPLTENGLVRIMSNPSYSRQIRFTPAELIAALQRFANRTDHKFWPDSVSLRDADYFEASHIHGSRRISDIYLLGLAVNCGGRLATFDQGIPLSAVKQATSEHLCVI